MTFYIFILHLSLNLPRYRQLFLPPAFLYLRTNNKIMFINIKIDPKKKKTQKDTKYKMILSQGFMFPSLRFLFFISKPHYFK